jgi:two-component system KDP operon response regulator KdpE
VWGSDEYNPDVVKKYIGRLREKIEDNPNNPVMLLSEWGIGYKFVNPQSNQ